MVWRQWISRFTCTRNWADTSAPTLIDEQQQKSSFTCTTDLQYFITGRPRQITILNCMCLNGYIVVSWWKRGVKWVSRSYLGTVKFPSLIFSRFRHIKPTNAQQCMKVYFTHRIAATCFGHSCGHLQAGPLQRVGTARYYISFWTNAQI